MNDIEIEEIAIGTKVSTAHHLLWRIKEAETEMRAMKEIMIEQSRRIATLETQRTPQDGNDDPEWFG